MPSSAPQARPILDIEHATAYRGERQIFSDLSLKVDRRVHSVIPGSNGAGKSTLLKLFSMEVHPVTIPGGAWAVVSHDL
jgi:ABC-type molybdenum transport system ATPase subunit/photorepair protein PhrA